MSILLGAENSQLGVQAEDATESQGDHDGWSPYRSAYIREPGVAQEEPPLEF